MPRHFMTLAAPPAVVLALALPAGAQHVDVEEYVLDNGMTFLLVPRHEEPNTISCGWVAKVGSVNERPGITGISHFFEHMMFKGTTTIGTSNVEADAEFMRKQKAVKDRINAIVWGEQYDRARRGEIDDPWDAANDTDELKDLRVELRSLIEAHRDVIVDNEFSKIYENAGGTGMNAFTSEDMTFYFITVPSNKFELWAWMESDRLADSVFREFYAERDVVHEERRTGLESRPTGELSEQFDALFWQSSPYSWSVIGWPSDLQSYTREEFDAYFNVYYRPNNLVGIVAGDFDPEDVKTKIASYFGRLKRGDVEPPPVVTLEMEQLAEKRLIGECDCQPQVEVRYHTVPFNHRDEFALDIMAALLNGRTGRLYKTMVEGREIASVARAQQESRKYAGFFSFGAEVKGDAVPPDLEKAWYEELDRLIAEPVPAEELQKVRNQSAADAYRGLQANSALLFQLGIFEALGSWEYINESPSKLAAVTAADVQRVARTYFVPTNRCIALFTRRPGGPERATTIDDFPEHRQQIEFFLARIEAHTPAELRNMLAQMPPLDVLTPEQRPLIKFMLSLIKERIELLEKQEEDAPDG